MSTNTHPCILLLDVDGVLNSAAWFARCRGAVEGKIVWGVSIEDMIDPTAVERLNRIVEATNCKVVLSSSWRLDGDGFPTTQKWLERAGFRHHIEDQTPYLSTGVRGDEVSLHLAHYGLGRPYCLLDDQPEDNHPGRWVSTTFDNGLLDEHVDLAIKVLQTPIP